MPEQREWYEDYAMPALLRAARGVYQAAVRRALGESGFEDLPPNGPFVLGAIARTDAPMADIIQQLRVSKQAAGQLVDTLATRGYLERAVDPDDRRRLNVALTERGMAAAAAVRSAVEAVDSALVARAGAEEVAQTRATLATLVSLVHADA